MVSESFGVVFLNIKAFGKMFSGDIDPSKNLSGPIGIAQIFGNEWDWGNFWRIVGLFSMVLAFMNLLTNTSIRWWSRYIYYL